MKTGRIVLAEYFVTGDATLLFIGRDDFEEPQIEEINLAQDELRQRVTAHFAVAGQMGEIQNLNLEKWQADFGSLISPLLAWTEEGDTIWFVPHDVLHYLPLHALMLDGRSLIERNAVCYSPSASVMRFCRTKRKNRRERALVLGDSRSDLLYAYEESFEVAALFGTRPYLQNQATKTLLREMLAQTGAEIDILHFSCHGKFQSDDPLQSSIVLAPENADARTEADLEKDNPSHLTAAEIFGLSLHADLVTLSACETGVNERKPGDELLGLTRALIYAGTPSVLVSLWSVEELSTTLLMQHFYTLLRGASSGDQTGPLSKVEALQQAQLYVKNLTAQQVIVYCNQRLTDLGQGRDAERELGLLLARARAQTLAGDLRQALAGYQDAQQKLQGQEGVWATKCRAEAGQAIPRLKLKLRKPPEINYETRPFEHIFYWAPFVLVGDWK
jgi:CHAT domain-containing protein